MKNGELAIKSRYVVAVAFLSLVYYGSLVLVDMYTQAKMAHDVALVLATTTLSMMAIYLCDAKDMRADIVLFTTIIAYLCLLLPLAYFTPPDWFFLNIANMVYFQGLPTLAIVLTWNIYHSILNALDKTEGEDKQGGK